MSILVDTSAFLAILDTSDVQHQRASEMWEKLVTNIEIMVCHNYILVETSALVQRRLGMEAIQVFHEDITPLLNIEWVNESYHRAGMAIVLAASRRKLSLVDCVSFEIMRRRVINRVFCFDAHFAEQGFECLPE